MSSVDERIVSMQFDNRQFEKGVETTIGSLDNLKNNLDFSSSKKGVEDLQGSFNRFSMGGMGTAVESVTAKFSAMGAIAFTTLQNITNRAVDAGIALGKSLSSDNIKSGLQEYETNLNSIQTVLANTSSKGTTLDQVNEALEELNKYSDMTIYNFSEMARNIGTFTAAGVDLETSVNSIKGIANLAAVSGSDSNQAATAMYQLSQAISTGTLKLEDWNSVTNAGMGGQVFQDALKETARIHGEAVDTYIEDEGSFRESLKHGWITADVLNETLMKFTGDLSAAQLESMGYNQEQIEGILAMGVTATDAATKVKTFTQLMDTLKEGVGSGWAMSWQLILGDFGEAKALFTDISDSLGGFLGSTSDARNELLGQWKDLGGRQALIQAFWYALNALMSTVNTLKDAFRDVFPKKSAAELVKMTEAVRDFFKRLNDGVGQLGKFRDIMRGVFSIFSIGWEFVKAFVGFLKDLFSTLSSGTGGPLMEFLKGIADWVFGLDQAIKKGDVFRKFFDKLLVKVQVAVQYLEKAAAWVQSMWDRIDFKRIQTEITNVTKKIEEIWNRIDFKRIQQEIDKVVDAFKRVFSGINFDSIGNSFNNFIDKIKNGDLSWQDIGEGFERAWAKIVEIFNNVKTELEPIADAIERLWNRITEAFNKVAEKLRPVLDFIKNAFNDLKENIKESFSGITADQAAAGGGIAIGAGIVAGLALLVKKIKNFVSELGDFGLSDLLSGIGETFGALTGHLNAMTAQVKAKTLLTIAAAIALLTISVVALAMIDADALAKSMTAIAVGFGQLLAATAILTKIAGAGGFVKIPLIAGSMILLGGAVLILAIAVKKLSGLDYEKMNQGLVGITAMLAVLTTSMKVISGISGGILRASVGMIAMAGALLLLSTAVKSFAEMDWATMGRGMAGVATGLGVITASMKLMPPNILANSVGLIAIAGALRLMSFAVSSFADMDWAYMGKGMAGVAASLLVIAGAMRLMPKNIMAQSIALNAVGTSLLIIGKAVSSMGGQSWEEIGKGLATLAGSLGILALGLKAMTASRGAAASLLLVAVALGMITPVLVTLGNLPWQVLLVSLGGLAAMFTLIGLAGLLLKPITPAITLLGLALLAAGFGMTLFGAGALLVAQSISILIGAGEAGVAMFSAMIGVIIAMLPQIAEAVGLAMINFVTVIAEGAPTIVAAFTAILLELLAAVVTLAPQLAATFGTLLGTILDVVTENVPKIVQAGFDLLISFLDGISDNVDDVVTAAVEVITEFIDAIADNIGDVIDSGIGLVIAVIEGISDGIVENAEDLATATAELAAALIEGLIVGLGTFAATLIDKLLEMIGDAWNAVLEWLGIASPSKKMIWVGEMMMEGMVGGIDQNGQAVADSATQVGKDAVSAMQDSLSGMPNPLDGIEGGSPVIKPVLDLSGVETESSKLNRMFTDPSISASASLTQANAISSENALVSATSVTGTTPTTPEISFTQINNSPESLPAAEIYRNTRSMLSSAKGALSTG